MNTPWFNFFLSEVRAHNPKGVRSALEVGFELCYIEGEMESLVINALFGLPPEFLDQCAMREPHWGRSWAPCFQELAYLHTPLFEGTDVCRNWTWQGLVEAMKPDPDAFKDEPRAEAWALFQAAMNHEDSRLSLLLKPRHVVIEEWYRLIAEGSESYGAHHALVHAYMVMDVLDEQIPSRHTVPDARPYRFWNVYAFEGHRDSLMIKNLTDFVRDLRIEDADTAYTVISRWYKDPKTIVHTIR